MELYEKVKNDIETRFGLGIEKADKDYWEGYSSGYVNGLWRYDFITDEQRDELKKIIKALYVEV